MRFDIKITGDTEITAWLMGMPSEIMELVSIRMEEIGDYLVSYIQDQELSGQLLEVRSGKLRDSIEAEDIERTKRQVILHVGAYDVDYAAILERGGTTAPHTIVPTKAQALHFFWRGEEVFRRQVNHPGSHIPAFEYMATALLQTRGDIQSMIADAINEAVMKT